MSCTCHGKGERRVRRLRLRHQQEERADELVARRERLGVLEVEHGELGEDLGALVNHVQRSALGQASGRPPRLPPAQLQEDAGNDRVSAAAEKDLALARRLAQPRAQVSDQLA